MSDGYFSQLDFLKSWRNVDDYLESLSSISICIGCAESFSTSVMVEMIHHSDNVCNSVIDEDVETIELRRSNICVHPVGRFCNQY